MKRRLDWPALPGILISLIMTIFGILFFIRPAVSSGSFSLTSFIFPLLWIVIILLFGIQNTLRFFGRRAAPVRDREVLSNLYGPDRPGNRLDDLKNRLARGAEERDAIDISEALYQLELMKLDGAISDEEYHFVKADLMKKQSAP